MLYVVAALLIVILIVLLYNFFFKKKETEKEEYKVKDTDKNTLEIKEKFMYQVELKILSVLNEIDPANYIALPKISLGNLLQPKGSKVVYNSLATKTLDYVIFDRAKMVPVLIVDIYDNSFNDEALAEQDPNINQILKDLSLPLISILVRGSFNTDEFKATIVNALKPKAETEDKK